TVWRADRARRPRARSPRRCPRCGPARWPVPPLQALYKEGPRCAASPALAAARRDALARARRVPASGSFLTLTCALCPGPPYEEDDNEHHGQRDPQPERGSSAAAAQLDRIARYSAGGYDERWPLVRCVLQHLQVAAVPVVDHRTDEPCVAGGELDVARVSRAPVVPELVAR